MEVLILIFIVGAAVCFVLRHPIKSFVITGKVIFVFLVGLISIILFTLLLIILFN
tara:strand:- start:102 stop:266 length:165 start_codon:yes stop_codon:yes gene_type:complete